jgi:hypothetical protein
MGMGLLKFSQVILIMIAVGVAVAYQNCAPPVSGGLILSSDAPPADQPAPTESPVSTGSSSVVVSWQNAVGVVVGADQLTKNATDGWGNSGAASSVGIASGNGFAEFSTAEINKAKSAGLSRGIMDLTQTTLNFGLLLRENSTFAIVENGSIANDPVMAYAAGDTFKVAIEAGVVRYYKNGGLIYTSSKAPSYPLLFDAVLYSNGATLTTAKIFSDAALINYTTVAGGPNGVGDGSNNDRASYCPSGKMIVSGDCNCGTGNSVVASYASNTATWYCSCSGTTAVGQVVSYALCK